jgi:hypothetical protein
MGEADPGAGGQEGPPQMEGRQGTAAGAAQRGPTAEGARAAELPAAEARAHEAVGPAGDSAGPPPGERAGRSAGRDDGQ